VVAKGVIGKQALAVKRIKC